MHSPSQLAPLGCKESSTQVALFAWCAMAARFGLTAANDDLSYTVPGYAANELGLHNDAVPELSRLFAIKNEEKGGRIRGALAKAAGVKPGVPDLMLPVPKWKHIDDGKTMRNIVIAMGLFIELKREKPKGIVSELQVEWHGYLHEVGYRCEVCYNWRQARDVLLSYLGRDNG